MAGRCFRAELSFETCQGQGGHATRGGGKHGKRENGDPQSGKYVWLVQMKTSWPAVNATGANREKQWNVGRVCCADNTIRCIGRIRVPK